MKLTSDDLHLLEQCAISAAYQAGHLISSYRDKDLEVKSKSGGDSEASQVVTEVDFHSQEIIFQILKPCCEIYDLAMLSEESPDDRDRLEKDYFWSIDPLDGTLPFVESTPGYSVSIGLVSKSGVPQIGVIYDPVKEVLYHAVIGKGLYKDGNPWQPISTSIDKEKPLTVMFDRSFQRSEYFQQVIDEMKIMSKEHGYDGLEIVRHGGGAMNACWTLEKSPACYFKFPKEKPGGGSIWDYSASACLFNESQGFCSDIYGNPLDLNREDSTYMNHRAILYTSHRELSEWVIDLYERLKSK